MDMPKSKFSKATSMNTLQILMIVVIFMLVAYGVGYFSGRLHGYHQGLDKTVM
jgi:predicted Na+-dependent transporter